MFKFAKPLFAVLMVGAVGASAAYAQEMDDEDYVKARIAHYREIGTSFKGISDEMKSAKPKMPNIVSSAAAINSQAKQQYSWFRPGSGPESEEKTKAKPVIWSKPKEFKAAQDKFLAESGVFLAAAKAAKDPKALQPQFKALSQTCANCHNTFREE